MPEDEEDQDPKDDLCDPGISEAIQPRGQGPVGWEMQAASVVDRIELCRTTDQCHQCQRDQRHPEQGTDRPPEEACPHPCFSQSAEGCAWLGPGPRRDSENDPTEGNAPAQGIQHIGMDGSAPVGSLESMYDDHSRWNYHGSDLSLTFKISNIMVPKQSHESFRFSLQHSPEEESFIPPSKSFPGKSCPQRDFSTSLPSRESIGHSNTTDDSAANTH